MESWARGTRADVQRHVLRAAAQNPLFSYFTQIRDQFDDFERKAKMLVNVDYAEERVRKRSRKVSTHDGPAVETEFSSAKDNFKVQVFTQFLTS